MSAGRFRRSRYVATYGNTTNVHPIRVQPETLALVIGGVTNTASTSPFTSPISAQISRSRRGLGLHARTVTVVFTDTAPTGYTLNSPIRLPLLTPEIAIAATPGVVGTYLENSVEVVGSTAEEVK